MASTRACTPVQKKKQNQKLIKKDSGPPHSHHLLTCNSVGKGRGPHKRHHLHDVLWCHVASTLVDVRFSNQASSARNHLFDDVISYFTRKGENADKTLLTWKMFKARRMSPRVNRTMASIPPGATSKLCSEIRKIKKKTRHFSKGEHQKQWLPYQPYLSATTTLSNMAFTASGRCWANRNRVHLDCSAGMILPT